MADSSTNNQFWSTEDLFDFNSQLFNDHFGNGMQFNINLNAGNTFANQEVDAKVNFQQTFADKDNNRVIDASFDVSIQNDNGLYVENVASYFGDRMQFRIKQDMNKVFDDLNQYGKVSLVAGKVDQSQNVSDNERQSFQGGFEYQSVDKNLFIRLLADYNKMFSLSTSSAFHKGRWVSHNQFMPNQSLSSMFGAVFYLMEKNRLAIVHESDNMANKKTRVYMHSDNQNSRLGAQFEYDHSKNLCSHEIAMEILSQDGETQKKVKVDDKAQMEFTYRYRLCNQVLMSISSGLNLAKPHKGGLNKDLPISIALDIDY